MITKSFARKDAERLVPLLRSIGRELHERNREVVRLEERLSALAEDAADHRGTMTAIEAQLSTQRRELRRVERELNDLGCDLDADHPLRILIPGRGERYAYEGMLDRTQFYRQAIDVPH